MSVQSTREPQKISVSRVPGRVAHSIHKNLLGGLPLRFWLARPACRVPQVPVFGTWVLGFSFFPLPDY
jgi:hypothetical protein